MKKLLLFNLLLSVSFFAGAQHYDVVTQADTDIYRFHAVPAVYQIMPSSLDGTYVVQAFPPSSTHATVYGVALVFRNTHLDGKLPWEEGLVSSSDYAAVMMGRSGPDFSVPGFNPILRPLSMIDSVPLNTFDGRIKRCNFRYEGLSDPNHPTGIFESPCHEFYFDTPHSPKDTFYVGRKWWVGDDNGYFYPAERVGRYFTGSSNWYIYQPFGAFVEYYRYWGFAFPIIGFRCKPIEYIKLQLSDVNDSGATVQWSSVEEGTTYNVRLSSSDGSVDSVVVTDDTSYTFSGLPTGKRYDVQVRKQCHYATSTYDTTVYSPWTTSFASFVLGECEPVPNVQVAPSGVTATVTWDTFPGYLDMRLYYGLANTAPSTWTEVDVTGSTQYTLTDLEFGSAYGVRLRAKCAFSGNMTPWSNRVDFIADTVGGAGIDMESTAAFSVRPNPVHGTVEVTLPQPLETEGRLVLYDLGGREVRQKAVPAGSRTATLDTQDCPPGAYLLKLITPQATSTVRLLVE